jgi:hypothetical protein
MRKSILILMFLGCMLNSSKSQYKAGFLGLKNAVDIGFERVQYMSVKNTFDTIDESQLTHMKKMWAPSVTYTRALGPRTSVALSYMGFGERNVKFDWKTRSHNDGYSFYGVMSRWSHNLGLQLAFYKHRKGFYAPFGSHFILGADMEIWTNSLDQFTVQRIEDASGTGILVYSKDEYPPMSATNTKTRLNAGFGHKFVLGKRDFLSLSFTVTSAAIALSNDKINYYEPASGGWNRFADNNMKLFFDGYSKYSMEYSFYRLRAAYGIFF